MSTLDDIFGVPTVDSILAGFTKTVDRLKTLSVQLQDKSVEALNQATHYTELADSFGSESIRAKKVADNINKILEQGTST